MHRNKVRTKSSSLKWEKKTKILQAANIYKTPKEKEEEDGLTNDDEEERLFDKIASTDDLVS